MLCLMQERNTSRYSSSRLVCQTWRTSRQIPCVIIEGLYLQHYHLLREIVLKGLELKLITVHARAVQRKRQVHTSPRTVLIKTLKQRSSRQSLGAYVSHLLWGRNLRKFDDPISNVIRDKHRLWICFNLSVKWPCSVRLSHPLPTPSRD